MSFENEPPEELKAIHFNACQLKNDVLEIKPVILERKAFDLELAEADI